MRQPNPVVPIAQQRQQFQLGQRRQPGQPPQFAMGQQPNPIQEQVQELAMEIYARLVAGQHLDDRYTSAMDQTHLRQLAKDAQTAATAYFSSLGVQFTEEPTQ